MKANPSKKIKWGIIGLGKIAHKFASDLLTVSGSELYAVASRSEENANSFAETYKARKAYSNYLDLVQDTNLDAVYIATPHSFHEEHSIMCLKNNIAVLCEKPFAMNTVEVNEMIKAAKTNNTLLMEALWTSFLPHFIYLQRLINNITYGKILKLEVDFGFVPQYDSSSRVFKKSLGGGSLLDIGIYPIFAAISTLGLPESIIADATFFENGVDSSCNMVFNYKNNVIANLKSSFKEHLNNEAIYYCEDAVIKLNSPFHGPTNITITQRNGKSETIDFDYLTLGYSYEIEHFNNLLKTNQTQSNIMTFEFSQNLIKTLDKVRYLIGMEY